MEVTPESAPGGEHDPVGASGVPPCFLETIPARIGPFLDADIAVRMVAIEEKDLWQLNELSGNGKLNS
jgi:hypothetical protein